MAEYYAVERSPEYLAHYGVKGMRWGVRKAIESGNKERLSKNYMKAVKKLGKLSLNANRGVMQKRYAAAKSRMAMGAASSAAMSSALTAAANGHLPIKERALISAGAGLAGAAAGALANSRGILSKRHISDKGHARAIEKRNQWRRDMKDAFKGTAYGGRAQKKFHQQITAISDVSDPRGYVHKQHTKAVNEARSKRAPTVVVNLSGRKLDKKTVNNIRKLQRSKKRISRI